MTTDDPDTDTVAATLFEELRDENGLVQADSMTDEWLESVRSRVHSGALPAFITTDYAEGWRIYARHSIAEKFTQFSTRNGSRRIRHLFPLTHSGESTVWADADERTEEAVEHATNLLHRHVNSAVLLHGSRLVASGKASWADVRREVAAAANAAIKTAEREEREESTIPLQEAS